MKIRVICYQLPGFKPQRLLTSMLDAERDPAAEITQLYHQRWELETGFDELHTHTLERLEAFALKRRTEFGKNFRAGRGVQPGAPGNGPGGRSTGGQSFTNFVPDQSAADPDVVAQRVGGGWGRLPQYLEQLTGDIALLVFRQDDLARTPEPSKSR